MILVLIAAVFVVIPVFVEIVSDREPQNIRNRTNHIMGTTMVAGVSVLAAYLVLGSRVTVYEYLLIDSVVAAIAVFLQVEFQKKRLDVTDALRFVFLICMAAVIYSILTYGQTQIHGDTATASLLTKAQLEHGQFFPKSWYYVNGDIWVLSLQLFVAPFVIFMENQALARMLGSVLLVVVTVWSLYVHSKKALYDESWLLAVPLMFVFLAGERDMILYQVAYTIQMVFLVAGAAWMFRIYEGSCGKRAYVILGVFVMLLVAGGIRDVAEIVLPLWLTCMVLNYLNIRNSEAPDWRKIWKEWIRLTLSVMVPAAVGLAVHIYRNDALLMVDTSQNALVLVSSLDDCIENVFWYISSLFFCFGFHGGAELISLSGIWSMCSIVVCSIVVFVVPVLQARKLKQESAYVQFLFAFCMIHNLLMFALTVFLVGKDRPRYLLTSNFAWILVSARYIYVYWISQKHFEKIIWAGLFAVASALGCLALGVNSIGWEDNLSDKMEVVSQLKEKGLTKGYGRFWEAYSYEVYSNFDLRFGAVAVHEDTVITCAWLVDADVFIPEETNTFLLLGEEENELFTTLHSDKFEAPIDYFEIKGNHIYVFDYDIAADMD